MYVLSMGRCTAGAEYDTLAHTMNAHTNAREQARVYERARAHFASCEVQVGAESAIATRAHTNARRSMLTLGDSSVLAILCVLQWLELGSFPVMFN